MRNNEEKEQKANNEDLLTCDDVGNVRESDNNEVTLYGDMYGSTLLNEDQRCFVPNLAAYCKVYNQ